jgi:hypothetical protein
VCASGHSHARPNRGSNRAMSPVGWSLTDVMHVTMLSKLTHGPWERYLMDGDVGDGCGDDDVAVSSDATHLFR